MVRIFKLETKKTLLGSFDEEVNREIASLEQNKWTVLDIKFVEAEKWDYPKYVPTLNCLITAKREDS